MTKEMEDNLTNENNKQYFADVTYYYTPPNSQGNKLFIIMSFNKEKFKSILCSITLLCNDVETFSVILEHLKLKYKFNPNKVTIDYSKSEYLAFKNIFNNIIIIPCFYNFCKNIIRHLPEIKSKTNTIENFALDLFDNIKLLCFVEYNNIINFYDEIKHKFRVKFPKFFKYLDNFYI